MGKTFLLSLIAFVSDISSVSGAPAGEFSISDNSSSNYPYSFRPSSEIRYSDHSKMAY